MITWRLWRCLRYPNEEHPVFDYAVASINRLTPPWYILLILIIAAPMLIIPGLVFAGTTYSLIWTMTISSTIKRTEERSVYDQFAVLPPGRLGVSWLLTTAVLHRNTAFERLYSPGLWMIRVIVLFLIASGDVLPYFDTTTPDGQVRTAITFVACLVILITDTYQSVVSAALIGLIVPGIVRDRFSVSALAFSAQMGLLMVLYGLAIAFTALLLPSAQQATEQPISYGITLAILVTAFLCGREWLNFGLWRLTCAQHNTNLSDKPIMLDWSSKPLL